MLVRGCLKTVSVLGVLVYLGAVDGGKSSKEHSRRVTKPEQDIKLEELFRPGQD